ncbi:MAG: hypothetical protein IK121_03760, partial [Lachnospiraceae bacterium]|nr:hypothetical protein [Lachnospiraceae bacterium]
MEGAPKSNQETPEANPWESLVADLEAIRKKKESEEASADKPQWDPRLTPEQIDDMIQKGIYEPVGPEYKQALGEFGITDATTQGQEQTQAQTTAEGINAHSVIDENGIRTEGYLASEQGKQELNSEAEFDRLAAKLEQAVKDGRMTEEHARALLEKQLNKAIDNIDGIRQDYKDAQVVGTPEEQAAYQAWLKAHDAENIKNLEKRGQLSEEEKAKLEEEERKKLELEKLKQKQEEDQKALDEEKKKLEELEKRRQELEEAGPLTAINADFTHDKKELARDRAERMINAEKEKAGLIKRIWKHTLFKKYYQKKYERQILAGERSIGKDEDGNDFTIDNIIEDRSGSAIERFVRGATEDMRYIHQEIGENGGEKLTEADAETTQLVREAIEEFAQAKIPEDGTLEDLKREFNNKIKRLQAEAKDQGRSIDSKLINNYFEVAVQARERVGHGIAMEKVMEG